jgi:HipA-like protein
MSTPSATGPIAKALQAVKDFFTSWGRPPRAASAVHSGRVLYLYLPVGADQVAVGVLSQEGKEFVFRYTEQFAGRVDLPALSPFPDRTRTYRSAYLWPFFEVRLPPLERQDVAEVIQTQKLDPDDTLGLLAVFGRKALTTPYEFRLEKVHPTDTTFKIAAT